LKYAILLSRQAERYFKKLQEKVKTQVLERLIGLEDQAYEGKRLHGDLKENYTVIKQQVLIEKLQLVK